jgi:hypothetical protein
MVPADTARWGCRQCRRWAVPVASAALVAACASSTATSPVTRTSGAVAPRPAATRTSAQAAPTPLLRSSFQAFFDGCEDGQLPPAGIQVTCDPSDGSDTADGAAAAFCERVATLLAPVVMVSKGTTLGVMNVNFTPSPSGVSFAGSRGELLRCAFPGSVVVDVAGAPAVHTGQVSSAPVPGLSADRCQGRVTPTVEVACLDPDTWGLALTAPTPRSAATLQPVLGRLAADLGAPLP